MRKLNSGKPTAVKILFTAFAVTLSILLGTPLMAQDVPEKVNVDVNLGSENAVETGWYAHPWVWVVGVALFIIIIIALTRGRSRRDI